MRERYKLVRRLLEPPAKLTSGPPNTVTAQQTTYGGYGRYDYLQEFIRCPPCYKSTYNQDDY